MNNTFSQAIDRLSTCIVQLDDGNLEARPPNPYLSHAYVQGGNTGMDCIRQKNVFNVLDAGRVPSIQRVVLFSALLISTDNT
jgi:NADPH-dependent glutamate synthase beta subunit-like oxidoreductase